MLKISHLSVQYNSDFRSRNFWWGSFLRSCWWKHTSPPHTEGTKPFILGGLSLEVQTGEFLVILGASGTGKTTLLRTIAGLKQPSEGEILIGGIQQNRLPPHRRDVAYVFQSGGWYDHLTVQQHFEIDFSRRKTSRTPADWMERVGLSEFADQNPPQLSGGQLQRLAIGRALMRGKAILLLDEPLNQLDTVSRQQLLDLLRQIHQEGQTVVCVTHDQQDVLRLATRVAVLHGGVIQQVDTPQEIYETPQHVSVGMAIGVPSMEFFQHDALPGVEALRNRFLGSRNAIVGIRPRDWVLVKSDSSDRVQDRGLQKIVNEFETLYIQGRWGDHAFGDGQILGKVDTGLATVSALLDAYEIGPDYLKGAMVSLRINVRKVNWFDPQNGNRIDYP